MIFTAHILEAMDQPLRAVNALAVCRESRAGGPVKGCLSRISTPTMFGGRTITFQDVNLRSSSFDGRCLVVRGLGKLSRDSACLHVLARLTPPKSLTQGCASGRIRRQFC